MRLSLALCLTVILSGLALADPPSLPSFKTLTVVRGIEWGQYYDQLKLTLTKRADGTYRADITGEDYPNVAQDLTVQEADLQELKQALWAMRGFSSGTSFAGEGNHWYTEVKLDGKQPDGQDWNLDLWFFDSNSRAVSEKVANLEDASRKLIEKLIQTATPAPAASGGMAGMLGAGS